MCHTCTRSPYLGMTWCVEAVKIIFISIILDVDIFLQLHVHIFVVTSNAHIFIVTSSFTPNF